MLLIFYNVITRVLHRKTYPRYRIVRDQQLNAIALININKGNKNIVSLPFTRLLLYLFSCIYSLIFIMLISWSSRFTRTNQNPDSFLPNWMFGPSRKSHTRAGCVDKFVYLIWGVHVFSSIALDEMLIIYAEDIHSRPYMPDVNFSRNHLTIQHIEIFLFKYSFKPF